MPMIRYEIRNEYALADPELCRAADKDDPEALLEAVAMAGLVGVLRQLGDLAEFAAEIFHELHEEVMATAARGHGLMLRVQQLEAEVPSIEKAFLSQSSHLQFNYNAGIEWHSNVRIDQNLITREDMPRFILDSYEECRGPPRLFMLDKFDIAGAGACLKRYSDPSFFKSEFASSGIMESEVRREKRARKVKKKVSRWRNGEAVESSLITQINSNLQQVPEKNPTRRVKLKARHLNGVDASRSYMESLLEVNSPEEKVLEDLKGRSTKSINLSISAPAVHEILIDNSDKYSPSNEERNPSQPPNRQTTEIPSNELQNQKANGEEFFETLPEPFGEAKKLFSTFPIAEKKEMLVCNEGEAEGSIDSYNSNEVGKNTPVLNKSSQADCFAEEESITERFADGYRSDDIGSEVENYMDALNTIESEIETDSESKPKLDQGFAKGISETNKGLNESLAKVLVPDSFQDSATPLVSQSIFPEGISKFADSDGIGSLTGTDAPEKSMINFDMAANFESILDETHDRASEELHRNNEATEFKPISGLLFDGHCSTETSDIPNIRLEIGEASSASCVTDSTSTLLPMCPQGSFNEAQSITSQTVESSCHLKSDCKVAEDFDHNLLCTKKFSEDRQSIGLYIASRDVHGITHSVEHDGELFSEDMAIEIPKPISLKQDGTIHEQISLRCAEDLLLQEPESREQDTEVSGGSILSTASTVYPVMNSIVVMPDGLPAGWESGVQPEHLAAEMSPRSLTGTLEVDKSSNVSSFGGAYIAGNVHSTKDGEKLEEVADTNDMLGDISQSQRGVILEKIPARYFEDLSLPFTVHIGDSQQSVEHDIETCSERSISTNGPAVSPEASHNSLQLTEDEEIQNSVAFGELLPCAQPAVDVKNSDDTVKCDNQVNNFVMHTRECLSDIDGPQDSCNVEAGFVPLCSGNETILGGMQLQSNHEVIDESQTFVDDLRLPSGSKVSDIDENTMQTEGLTQSDDPITDVTVEEVADCTETYSRFSSGDVQLQLNHEVIDETQTVGGGLILPSGSEVSDIDEDAMQTEGPIQCDDAINDVTAEAVTDCTETYSRFPFELSDFSIQFQEDCVLGGADLDPHELHISESPTTNNNPILNPESNLPISHSSKDENCSPSASVFSGSEFASPDLADPSDANLSNGFCHRMLHEDSIRDLHPNRDAENSIHLLERGSGLSLEASTPCTHESVEEDISSSVQPVVPDETTSKAHAGDEPTKISLNQEVELPYHSVQSEIARFIEQHNTQDDSVKLNDKPSEPGSEQDPHIMINGEIISESDIPLPEAGAEGQLFSEASHPSQCDSEHTVNSLAPNVSAVELVLSEGVGPEIYESNLQQFSEQISYPVLSFQLQGVQEAPPLPPLPPLEWRMGKLGLGPLTSDRNLVQPLAEPYPFSASSTVNGKHPRGLGLAEANLFAPVPALEDSLLYSEEKKRQSLRLSEVPPIVEDKGYQYGTQGETVLSLNQSSLVKGDKHVNSHDASWGGMFDPSNLFAAMQSLEHENSQNLQIQGEMVQPLENKIPPLCKLLPALELERSQYGALHIDSEIAQSAGPYLTVSSAENDKYLYSFGGYVAENMQRLSLSAPLSTAGPMIPHDGFVSSRDEYQLSLDDSFVSIMEDEKPNGKFSSIRNRPRHPLIDAVAAHDKSKLRKVSELVPPSTKPKVDERNTLLEQIRNKSFNLKPAAMAKPNIQGPSTNLKVTAILEKANAIRQACVGSDEDDDSNWSDS